MSRTKLNTPASEANEITGNRVRTKRDLVNYIRQKTSCTWKEAEVLENILHDFFEERLLSEIPFDIFGMILVRFKASKDFPAFSRKHNGMVVNKIGPRPSFKIMPCLRKQYRKKDLALFGVAQVPFVKKAEPKVDE